MTSSIKCHYEVLGVQRDVSAEDLKKAYRKLALRWHPDKNPESIEDATREFRLIQQAFDVLSDPQERAWYDKHREAILRGGLGKGEKYDDNSLDVFQYYTSSCYSGYDDSETGFYTVYAKVFETLAEQDYPFAEDMSEDQKYPGFGHSESSYEEVVAPFYGFWESFCTAKSYVWVEKFDTREAPDRRVRRLMEADNKKLRDAAKKERNEEIRMLVAFVRKRDKRVQAYKKKLEERAAEIEKKMLEKQQKDLKERQKLLENYEEAGWSAHNQLEKQLKALESEFKSDGEAEEEESLDDDLYCVVCDKVFRSEKALSNHENSRKHKELAALLKAHLEAEEEEMNSSGGNDQQSKDDENTEDEEEESSNTQKLSKKQKKKSRQKLQVQDDDPSAKLATMSLDSDQDKQRTKSRKERRREKILSNNLNEAISSDSPPSFEEGSCEPTNTDTDSQLAKNKSQDHKAPNPSSTTKDLQDSQIWSCNTCATEYPTRNKLFQHLKATGHALRLPTSQLTSKTSGSSGGKKGKSKNKR